MLKGGFVNIHHKFFRVFGLTKMKLLLAFAVVGYNLQAINSFVGKTAAKVTAEVKKPRRKRRTGTWSEIIGGAGASGSASSGTGRSPPPT